MKEIMRRKVMIIMWKMKYENNESNNNETNEEEMIMK